MVAAKERYFYDTEFRCSGARTVSSRNTVRNIRRTRDIGATLPMGRSPIDVLAPCRGVARICSSVLLPLQFIELVLAQLGRGDIGRGEPAPLLCTCAQIPARASNHS